MTLEEELIIKSLYEDFDGDILNWLDYYGEEAEDLLEVI